MATSPLLSALHICSGYWYAVQPAGRHKAIDWQRWLVVTVMLLSFGVLAAPVVYAQTAPAYWGGPSPLAAPAPHRNSAASIAVVSNDSVGQEQPLSPSATAAASQLLTIAGTVYKANGAPLGGVQVDLAGEWDKHFFTTTDAQGNFRFEVGKDSLGESADVSVTRFPLSVSHNPGGHLPVLGFYRYAWAEIDFASSQPYQLRLGHIRRRKAYHCVKFR